MQCFSVTAGAKVISMHVQPCEDSGAEYEWHQHESILSIRVY